jgi:two-component system alkaline phosphatase synthesis response regulator PhoP
MDPLLSFPDALPQDLTYALRRSGHNWHFVAKAEQADADEATATEDGWSGAVVFTGEDIVGAVNFCRHVRRRDVPLAPLLLVITEGQLADLALRDDLFDDFCIFPSGLEEIPARLEHLFWRAGRRLRPELIEYGPLQLNLETYQAAVSGKVLDLTYMEYELLRFLAAHPAKVFTRETLLSRVWGYEYYGGARTVDVHVRRLRAKLGEEHAHLIQTVRSVGYRFGQVGWVPGLTSRTAEG